MEGLSAILSKYSDEETASWLMKQKFYLEYVLAIARYERCLHVGDMDACKICEFYLADDSHFEKDDPASKVHRINIADLMGENDLVREILETIKDDDNLSDPLALTDVCPTSAARFFDQTTKIKSAEALLQCCIKARAWTRAARMMEVLEGCSPGYFTSVSGYTHIWPSQRCLWAGLIAEHNDEPKLAMAYYMQSIFFYKKPYDNLRDAHERQNSMNKIDIMRAHNSLVRLLLRLRDQDGVPKVVLPVWLGKSEYDTFSRFKVGVSFGGNPNASIEMFALDTLEKARSRALLELMSNRSETPSQASEEWGKMEHMFMTWQDLRSLTRSKTEEETKEFDELNASLDTFKAAQYGKAKFLGGITLTQEDQRLGYEHYFEKIPRDALVITTTLSVDGMAVFAVDYTGIQHAAWSEAMNILDIQALVLAFLQEAREYAGEELSNGAVNALGYLSSVLLEPLAQHVKQAKHIIFVPSGALSRFPFGALLFNEMYLFLQKAVSQIPSLSALYHLSNRSWDQINVLQIAPIAKPVSMKEYLTGGEPPLPMAGMEALAIAALFNIEAIKAEDMTRETFKKQLETCDIVHLCTHGYVDNVAPYHSYISLKERFRVLDMLNIKTNISLVIFSACLTGIGTVTAGEDMIGFSHALLSAGANAFIGALWNVNDVATLIHMLLFYLAIRSGEGGMTIAEKWCWATTFFFLMENSEKINFLQRMLDIWDSLERVGKSPNEMVKNGRAKLQVAIDELSTEDGAKKFDFKHLYFWAPFIIVGHAGLGLSEKSHYEAIVAQQKITAVQQAVARARRQRIFRNPLLQTFSGMQNFLLQQSGHAGC